MCGLTAEGSKRGSNWKKLVDEKYTALKDGIGGLDITISYTAPHLFTFFYKKKKLFMYSVEKTRLEVVSHFIG